MRDRAPAIALVGITHALEEATVDEERRGAEIEAMAGTGDGAGGAQAMNFVDMTFRLEVGGLLGDVVKGLPKNGPPRSAGRSARSACGLLGAVERCARSASGSVGALDRKFRSDFGSVRTLQRSVRSGARIESST